MEIEAGAKKKGGGQSHDKAHGGGKESRNFGDEGSRSKRKREKGRSEWAREQVNRRARNVENQEKAKRRKLSGSGDELPIYATKFSKDEIESEARRPKKKVAVMIGYSGTGYKGMQINHKEKTIEGDLFSAFVAAGAISKANADDPKKSSFVRCARTDKGVHAAGNVISLKLIIEDPNIVSKINENLSSQIRVWGIEPTLAGFSAYQMCDSRIYEYLIPTHCFIPPHPRSFLGRTMSELAAEANDLEGYISRQKDGSSFWSETEDKYIRPLFGESEPGLAETILNAFYDHNSLPSTTDNDLTAKLELLASKIIHNPEHILSQRELSAAWDEKHPEPSEKPQEMYPLEVLLHHLKLRHVKAKKAYRISPERLARVKSTLSHFVGSHRFHNYTVEKTIHDPSANRVIKSLTVGENPIIIGDTEWLSIKIHGQSFMMHQIRKMISMAALLMRCGCHESRMQDTYSAAKLSIPKAPSLGLLLERPIFDEYSKRLKEHGKEPINFNPYVKEIEEFKQREIYERIFRVEEKENTFHVFFQGLDSTRSASLLYLSSLGLQALGRDIGGDVQELDEDDKGDLEEKDFEAREDGKVQEGIDGPLHPNLYESRAVSEQVVNVAAGAGIEEEKGDPPAATVIDGKKDVNGLPTGNKKRGHDDE